MIFCWLFSDVRNNRLGRKVPSNDVSDDEEVSIASTTGGRYTLPNGDRPSSTTVTNSRQSLASLKDSAYSGSSKPSLQRYDSSSSLRSSSGRTSSGFPASISANTLQRYDSLTSVDGPRSSRRSSRGDLSVNFDLGKSDSYKRERSPVVAMLSRVAVERELPVTKRIGGNVESRYVVGKFPTESRTSNVRIVPIQILSEDEPRKNSPRTSSMERSVSANAGFAQSKEYSKPAPTTPYARLESRERVVGGKQFVSTASLNDTSSDEEETQLENSILRAASPPRVPRVQQLQVKKSISVDDSETAGLVGLKNLGNTVRKNNVVML